MVRAPTHARCRCAGADRPRIERALRILENHLHLAAEIEPTRAIEAAHIRAVEIQPARVGFEEPHQATRERGLAATRFTDDAERLTAMDLQADTLDGAASPGGRDHAAC